MQRDYNTGVKDNVIFFVGNEVEHTPAFGMKTLFVTGVQEVDIISTHLQECKHIFFGANHSFNPKTARNWKEWETMIEYFLEREYLCSLDIPISVAEEFHENGLCEYNNFIPQIRVPLPYIRLWNYNTMLKLDDKDFNATNPGVWSHNLHELMDRKKFTSWDQYKDDKIV